MPLDEIQSMDLTENNQGQDECYIIQEMPMWVGINIASQN